MRFLLSIVLACLAAAPARAEVVSAYTEIDIEKDCSIFDINEEGGEFANFVCPGYKGYPVLIYTGDLRESLFYGFSPGPSDQFVWESFGAFNSTGPKIEWRIDRSGGREIPYATIHRWFVSNPESADEKTEVLVIEKVGQVDARDGCAVGLVVATGNAKANDTARKIADEQARGFACGADERVIVSGDVPLPDFDRQEN